MAVQQFQQRPFRVAALQWTPTQEGFNRQEFTDFLGGDKMKDRLWKEAGNAFMIVQEGWKWVTVWPGQWVTRDHAGRLSVLHEKAFEALYEPR